MHDELTRLYNSAAIFKAVYQFEKCGHVATFPDDALRRAGEAKTTEEARYWQDNSTANDHPSNTVGSQGHRPCPHCPRKTAWGPCELIERGREWDGPEPAASST